MSTVEERVNKLREDRLSREKARIEKLRELNLKKYNKPENPSTAKNTLPRATSNKSLKPEITSKNNEVKSKQNIPSKRPSTVPGPSKRTSVLNSNNPQTMNLNLKSSSHISEIKAKFDKPLNCATQANGDITSKSVQPQIPKLINDIKKKPLIDAKKLDNNCSGKIIHKKPFVDTRPIKNKPAVSIKKVDDNGDGKILHKRPFIDPRSARKSVLPSVVQQKPNLKPLDARKSMIPMTQQCKKSNPGWESVFDRLYKPKTQVKDVSRDTTIKPLEVKKVIKPAPLAPKRHTVCEIKPIARAAPIRRSISAVHFKKISKNELKNCMHKWLSVGEKLDKVHLKDINEDENVVEDKIVSAVKSERKRVKFQTPVLHNFNTPRPEELQSRLQNWLKKHGKSLQSYHHLQCFGLHHLSQRQIKPLAFEDACDYNDDENKENIALDSDSDNESYTANMNDRKDDFIEMVKKDDVQENNWRRASYTSSSFCDLNDTNNVSGTPGESVHHVDELLVGALNDLTELLREGFDWEQCARWLRAIHERFPTAPQAAEYWECRAALEGTRGDLPASIHCWEEAIAKGTQCSVVDANLDQLLDKFMHLKISPKSLRKTQPVDPKLVDVKNVFKSTFIKFAVQEAKLRQSNHIDSPRFTVTPVRRSGRLSIRSAAKRSPLRICASVRQAQIVAEKAIFVPNTALVPTP